MSICMKEKTCNKPTPLVIWAKYYSTETMVELNCNVFTLIGSGVTILQVSRFTDNMINGTQGWGIGMGHSLSPMLNIVY
jgi:hypothetical protein